MYNFLLTVKQVVLIERGSRKKTLLNLSHICRKGKMTFRGISSYSLWQPMCSFCETPDDCQTRAAFGR